MVLRREIFTKAKTGPCGALRNDSISAVGIRPELEDFAYEARVIQKNYEKSVNDGGKDIYSLEWFEGDVNQTMRGEGRSYYKYEFDGTKWIFYRDGKLA